MNGHSPAARLAFRWLPLACAFLGACAAAAQGPTSRSLENVSLPVPDGVFGGSLPAVFHRHSPDGSLVAFLERESSAKYPVGEIEGYALVIANANGQQRRIMSGHDIGLYESDPPCWSPDGRWLACFFNGELRLLETGGAGVESVIVKGSPRVLSGAAWSPNGKHLAVVADGLPGVAADSSRHWKLCVLGRDGQERFSCKVDNPGEYQPALAWSPDGNTIALVARNLLYVCTVSTDAVEPHLAAEVADVASTSAAAPQWSAAGDQLAFVTGERAYLYDVTAKTCLPLAKGEHVCDVVWVAGLDALLWVESREGAPNLLEHLQDTIDFVKYIAHGPDRMQHVPVLHEPGSGARRELDATAYFEDHGILGVDRMPNSVRQAFSDWVR